MDFCLGIIDVLCHHREITAFLKSNLLKSNLLKSIPFISSALHILALLLPVHSQVSHLKGCSETPLGCLVLWGQDTKCPCSAHC